MSHELDYPLFPIIEPEYPLFPIEQPIEIEEPISIVISDTPFFYVPDMPEFIREDYKGLEFEGVQYSWNEFDYRLQVEYDVIPEPSFYGLLLGFSLLLVALIKNKKK